MKVANECAVRGYLAGLSVVRKVDDSSRQCSVWAVGVRGPAVPALSCLLYRFTSLGVILSSLAGCGLGN